MPVTAVRTMLAYRSNVAQIELELEPAAAECRVVAPHRRRGREQLLFIQSAVELGDRLVQRAQQQLEENAGRLIVAAVQADRTPREPAADIVQEVRVAGPGGHDKPRRAQQMHLEQPAGRGDQPRDRAQPLADLHPAGLAESLEPARRRIVETQCPQQRLASRGVAAIDVEPEEMAGADLCGDVGRTGRRLDGGGVDEGRKVARHGVGASSNGTAATDRGEPPRRPPHDTPAGSARDRRWASGISASSPPWRRGRSGRRQGCGTPCRRREW